MLEQNERRGPPENPECGNNDINQNRVKSWAMRIRTLYDVRRKVDVENSVLENEKAVDVMGKSTHTKQNICLHQEVTRAALRNSGQNITIGQIILR